MKKMALDTESMRLRVIGVILVLILFVFCVLIASGVFNSVPVNETIVDGTDTIDESCINQDGDNDLVTTMMPSSGEVSSSSQSNISTTVSLVTISFDTNGGSNISSIQIPQGSHVDELPTPSMDYYRFAGWRLNGTVVDSLTTFDSDAVLTANWNLSEEWTDWSDWSDNQVEPQFYQNGESTGIVVREVESECISSEEGHYEYLYTYTYVTRTDEYTVETTSLTQFDYIDGWYVAPDGGLWMTEIERYIEDTPSVYHYRYRDRIP